MLLHGNDATIGDGGAVVVGSNCSNWTTASRTCAARFLFENGLASYMTVGLNFHRFYQPAYPMAVRRQYSPFVNRSHHELVMKQLTDNLRALSPWLAGVANDLEYGCWPSNGGIGNATAEQFMFPDLQERLGNAPSAMGDNGYPSFTDWPTAKAHPRPHEGAPSAPRDWTLEQLMYNMPKKTLNMTTSDVHHHDAPVVRISGRPGGNTTMFAQVFSPARTQRLTRIDLWLRLSPATALPAMPYISYFIALLKDDGSPDVDNPLQCAILRPKNRTGGKWVKCGISAKELPVASSSGLMDEWQPMKLYLNPEEGSEKAVLENGKQYALVLEIDTCWNEFQVENSPSTRQDGPAVDYEIAIHQTGVASTGLTGGAMVFAGGTWKSLPGSAATCIFYEPGSTAMGYTPNQLHAVRISHHSPRTVPHTFCVAVRTGWRFTQTSLQMRSSRWRTLPKTSRGDTSPMARMRLSTSSCTLVMPGLASTNRAQWTTWGTWLRNMVSTGKS
jgi:hypothetical protein